MNTHKHALLLLTTLWASNALPAWAADTDKSWGPSAEATCARLEVPPFQQFLRNSANNAFYVENGAAEQTPNGRTMLYAKALVKKGWATEEPITMIEDGKPYLATLFTLTKAGDDDVSTSLRFSDFCVKGGQSANYQGVTPGDRALDGHAIFELAVQALNNIQTPQTVWHLSGALDPDHSIFYPTPRTTRMPLGMLDTLSVYEQKKLNELVSMGLMTKKSVKKEATLVEGIAYTPGPGMEVKSDRFGASISLGFIRLDHILDIRQISGMADVKLAYTLKSPPDWLKRAATKDSYFNNLLTKGSLTIEGRITPDGSADFTYSTPQY